MGKSTFKVRTACIFIRMFLYDPNLVRYHDYCHCESYCHYDTTFRHLRWLWCGPWRRHQMETFSALLDLCGGNSPVTREFASQRPVTLRIDVFFDLCLKKQLSKQSRYRLFETPSRSLWRHCNANEAFPLLSWYKMSQTDNGILEKNCWTTWLKKSWGDTRHCIMLCTVIFITNQHLWTKLSSYTCIARLSVS